MHGSAPEAGVGELVVEREGATVRLTINRPSVRNALNQPLRRQLKRELRAADAARDIAAVVLTGCDPAFSAGLDLTESLSGSPASREYPDPSQVLRSLRVPVICAVNGPCYTGALELALSCSFLLASERATFADTHARLGMIAGWGMSALLPRAVGVRQARQMMLTGEPVDAGHAFRIGLVNEVVAHDDLLPRAHEVAEQISYSHQDAVRTTQELLHLTDGTSVDHALSVESEARVRWRADPVEIARRFSVPDVAVGSQSERP